MIVIRDALVDVCVGVHWRHEVVVNQEGAVNVAAELWSVVYLWHWFREYLLLCDVL